MSHRPAELRAAGICAPRCVAVGRGRGAALRGGRRRRRDAPYAARVQLLELAALLPPAVHATEAMLQHRACPAIKGADETNMCNMCKKLQRRSQQRSQVRKVGGHDAKVLVLVGIPVLLRVAAASSRCEGVRRRRVPLLLLPAAVAVWPNKRETPSPTAEFADVRHKLSAQCRAKHVHPPGSALVLRRTPWHLCLSSRRGLSCLLGLSYRRELRPASR